MRRAKAVSVLVFLAACAAPATEPTSTVTSTTTSAVSETTAPDAGSTLPGLPTSSTVSGRPVAPDFTLALGDGGTYTLSEGAKPVYLVFWAEW